MSAKRAHPRQITAASEIPSTHADPDSWVGIVCSLLSLSAAWVAAGSTGLIGHALRHGLAMVLLGGAFLIGVSVPGRPVSWRRVAGLAGSAGVAMWMLASPLPVVNVFGVAFILGVLACDQVRSAPFLVSSIAVLAFGLFKFAGNIFPSFWLLVDWISGVMSRAGGVLLFRRVYGGVTFCGLDYLVLMGVLLGCWTRFTGASLRKALAAGALILGAHLVYLTVLAYAPGLVPALPAAKESAFGVTPRWDWAQGVKGFIPWNVPVVGALLHLAVAGWLLQRLHPPPPSVASGTWTDRWLSQGGRQYAVVGGIGLAAILVPLLATLNTRSLALSGKKIVLYEKGFLNWLKPKHGEYGRLSVGMYGVLPEFLRSYGATCVVSPDLAEADLAGADLLVLIFPNKPWAPEQLERIWQFTREGGSLLVLGEHTVEEKEGGNRFNDVLKPTDMRVAFDSAMFEVGGWLESYDALSHPVTAGLQDHRNEFGVVVGASVEARWPARPLLVGRFGWADPGDVTNDEKKGGSMMGNHRYDSGEKLGDVLLAAEQRLGRGRVVVFGDTSGFTNTILLGAHEFVTRLFGYLCHDAEIGWLRRLLAALGLGLLGCGLALRPRPFTVLLTAGLLAVALTIATAASHRAGAMLPDGRDATPNRLAYLSASHLERNSAESWREEGLGGLHLTLMRNGYLVLGMEEFDPQRLQRAGLLISVAPARKFSTAEIRAVHDFVADGGTFICTVGWPESEPSRPLLAELGFYVGGIGAATSGQPEPKPFGHFKAPYFNGGDYMAYVRFHAAWNVESSDPQAQPIAYGPRDPKGPPNAPDPTVILLRRIGRGKAIVVADTYFAANKNLEREGGQPFEGMRENADFWRWFLAYLNEQPVWTPPKPLPPAPATGPAAASPTKP